MHKIIFMSKLHIQHIHITVWHMSWRRIDSLNKDVLPCLKFPFWQEGKLPPSISKHSIPVTNHTCNSNVFNKPHYIINWSWPVDHSFNFMIMTSVVIMWHVVTMYMYMYISLLHVHVHVYITTTCTCTYHYYMYMYISLLHVHLHITTTTNY